MTTIAYRDGIMAADSRAFSGGSTPIGFKRKLFEMPDGSVVGVSTNQPGLGEWFVDWLSGKISEDPHNIREPVLQGNTEFTALHVTPLGNVFFYHDSLYPSGPLTDEFFAIGSGDRYAIGAMLMGASAVRAVEIAMQVDPWTDGEIVRVKIEANAGLRKAA